MDITSFRILPRNTAEGKRYVVDSNRNGSADPGESSLVRITDDGWQHVDSLDGPVHRETMGKDVGFWRDREVSHREGWIWDRRTVIDRPLDGKIDADEVGQIGWERTSDSSFSLGSEISQDKDGRLYLNRHDANYGPYRIIGQGDIESQRKYIDNDDNWIVKG